MKLDRLIAKHRSLGRKHAHQAIAAGEARVNGVVVCENAFELDRFAHVTLRKEVIQPGSRSLYLMLHKPVGHVSTTIDAEHPTVIDLIDDPDRATLHLAGRLDRHTSGLVLLTNDGAWSKRITEAAFKLPKTYLVETAEPIPTQAIAAFAKGFYFHTEDITTRPAGLEILAERQARLTLWEGRYHQVKRMFHRIANRVTALHRERVGEIVLPRDLEVGTWRPLTEIERDSVWLSASSGPESRQ